MNRKILYSHRCICRVYQESNQRISVTKERALKKKKKRRFQEKPLEYPISSEIPLHQGLEIVPSKVFHMKYKKNISATAKLILNTFQNKYIYYAIDDILYSLNSDPNERDSLLAVLYSPILSLQNNLSVNFFDIWIREVYIDEISKSNKFLKNQSKTFHQLNQITIKFFYKTSLPVKKQESLW